MNFQNWCKLGFMEQLSNISGEIKRMVDNHEEFMNNNANDYSEFYLNKILDLINATFEDTKNDIRRKKEIMDEFDELRKYISGDVDKEYILRYWNQYTIAIG